MSAGDMTPALQQAEATANKRHAELMNSTHPNAKRELLIMMLSMERVHTLRS